MTPVDEQVRDAWRTGGPMELHRSAEQLAAQGHEESAIYDALERLLLEERAAGADDATEDRITDVMERLTGWCHESNHIRTKRTTLPTEEEIAILPRWARVAFAARCARRGAALMTHFANTGPTVRADTETGIRYAERRAADPSTAVIGTLAISGKTVTDYYIQPDYDGTDPVAAVRYADSNALWAANAAVEESLAGVALHAAGAVRNVLRAARQGLVGWDVRVAQEIRRDYDHLQAAARGREWTDDTPVSPVVFGPLWPEGAPPGWPPVTEAPEWIESSTGISPNIDPLSDVTHSTAAPRGHAPR